MMPLERANRTDLLTAISRHIRENPADPFVDAISTKDSQGNVTDIRYYVYEVPEGIKAVFPYAVSTIVSEVDGGVIGGGFSIFQWQISIFGPASKLTVVNDLGDQCRNLFDDSTLVSPPCEFTCMYSSTVGGIREESSDPWMVAITFDSYP